MIHIFFETFLALLMNILAANICKEHAALRNNVCHENLVLFLQFKQTQRFRLFCSPQQQVVRK
jgi:hypothetical protein